VRAISCGSDADWRIGVGGEGTLRAATVRVRRADRLLRRAVHQRSTSSPYGEQHHDHCFVSTAHSPPV
jgi:hypothetical protein